MKKLLFPALVLIMLTAGCTCAANEPPVAYIDLITPTEVSTGETVTFEGHGTDADGTVVAYRWESSIDGDLSTRASFESSSLSEGEHTIGLKVQDNNGTWSKEAEGTLVVSGAATGPPVIDSFAASPGSISPGGTSTLSWEVTGADTASIDQGVGPVALSGTRPVAPVATTTYTLTATSTAGSATATAAVSVSGGAAGVPVISYFTADPETVPPGGPSTLSWSVSNADTVTISAGIESVSVGPSGSIIARPDTTTTFTLTATNAAGGTVATTQVVVGGDGAGGGAAGLPLINSFAANPGTITAGEASQLSWDVSNADTVMYAWNGAKSATSLVGTAQVSPAATTTYTLTATNSAGSVFRTVQVVVGAPPEEHTVTLYPEASPKSGQVQSTGGVFGIPTAGDLASNVAVKAYYGFDIAGLAGAEVTDAVLSLTTTTVIGTPWPDLMWLYIDAVDYGPGLDAGDFGLMGDPLGEVHSEPSGDVNINVTDAVLWYITHGAGHFQVMAWFSKGPEGTDNDSQADYWRCNARLTVTYLE